MSPVDHELLLRDPEFLNAVVHKMWIEDGLLQEYELLEERVTVLLETLSREIDD